MSEENPVLRDVKTWHNLYLKADLNRRAAMKRAHEAGFSYKQIAKVGGLNAGTVYKLVNREVPSVLRVVEDDG